MGFMGSVAERTERGDGKKNCYEMGSRGEKKGNRVNNGSMG